MNGDDEQENVSLNVEWDCHCQNEEQDNESGEIHPSIL